MSHRGTTLAAACAALLFAAPLHAAFARPLQDAAPEATPIEPFLVVRDGRDLLGLPFAGPTGELGKLRDLALRSSGEVAYAVLGHEGGRDEATRLFAVSWRCLKFEEAEGRRSLAVGFGAELLDDDPGFDPERWPLEADGRLCGELEGLDGGPGAVETAQAGAATVAPLTGLVGRPVVSPEGVELARLDGLGVDVERGVVNFVSLALQAGAEGPRRRVCLPWSVLGLRADGRLVVDLAREQLERAPEYDREELAPEALPDFCERVYDHLGAVKYWRLTAEEHAGER